MILFLNIFMAFVPILQFFVFRRPPHGNRPLWERIIESVAGKFGIKTPFGRRASQSTYVKNPLGANRFKNARLQISLLSEVQMNEIANQQAVSRGNPMARVGSNLGGRLRRRKSDGVTASSTFNGSAAGSPVLRVPKFVQGQTIVQRLEEPVSSVQDPAQRPALLQHHPAQQQDYPSHMSVTLASDFSLPPPPPGYLALSFVEQPTFSFYSSRDA